MSPGQHRAGASAEGVEAEAETKDRSWVPSILLGAVVAVLVGVGLLGWLNNGGDDVAATPATTPTPVSQPSETPTPTPTPSATPTPTPTPPPSPSASPTPTPTPTPASSRIPPSQVPRIAVLNQSGVAGEAARVAAELTNLGYGVTGVGNWRGNVPSTTVYYPPGEAAAAAQVAADLGVNRTRERVDPMRKDALTVIITAALGL